MRRKKKEQVYWDSWKKEFLIIILGLNLTNMGTSCSTCFGDSEGNTSQSQSHSQGRHQQGQSGVDRSTKREQMGRAAEERIRAVKSLFPFVTNHG